MSNFQLYQIQHIRNCLTRAVVITYKSSRITPRHIYTEHSYKILSYASIVYYMVHHKVQHQR